MYSSSHGAPREREESSNIDRSAEKMMSIRILFTSLNISIYLICIAWSHMEHMLSRRRVRAYVPHTQGASRERTCGWEEIFDEVDDELSVDQLQLIQQDRQENKSEIYSVAIARDPILRFISGYKSKIVCDSVGYSSVDTRDRWLMVSYLLQSVESNYGRVKVGLKQAVPFALPKWLSSNRCESTTEHETCCLSFREYVDSILLQMLVRDAINAHNKIETRVEELIPEVNINIHFIPQSELCRYDLFKYDEVHPLEQLNSTSFLTLNDKIGNHIEAPPAAGAAKGVLDKSSKRKAIFPYYMHQSKAQHKAQTEEPTREELAEAEEVLEKLRFYLDFDYSNDVIRGLYNFEENRDMYIQAVRKTLLNDHNAGLL